MTIDPTVANEDARLLLDMAERNEGDPLGHNSFKADPVDGDDEPTESDAVDFMLELIRDGLRGDQPGVRRNLLQWPTLKRMDQVTADTLLHIGVDPVGALTLHDCLGKQRAVLQVEDDEGLIHVIANEVYWAVHLKHGEIIWYSNGMLRINQQLPATVLAAASDKLLRVLVSHPALDMHDLRIFDIQINDDGCTVMVNPPIADLGARDLERQQRQRQRKAA